LLYNRGGSRVWMGRGGAHALLWIHPCTNLLKGFFRDA